MRASPGRAAAQRAALGQQSRAGSAVDRAVHAAAAQQRGVGGVDDGVDVEPRDVALDDRHPAAHSSVDTDLFHAPRLAEVSIRDGRTVSAPPSAPRPAHDRPAVHPAGRDAPGRAGARPAGWRARPTVRARAQYADHATAPHHSPAPTPLPAEARTWIAGSARADELSLTADLAPADAAVVRFAILRHSLSDRGAPGLAAEPAACENGSGGWEAAPGGAGARPPRPLAAQGRGRSRPRPPRLRRVRRSPAVTSRRRPIDLIPFAAALYAELP